MKLNKNKTLTSVQEEFHTTFPGLKIVFYQKKHAEHEGSPKKAEVSADLTLGEVNPDLSEGTMELDASMSVENFEQAMEDNFGLHVQVFRRSKEIWLQTVATDHWTLEVQNRKGMHSIQMEP